MCGELENVGLVLVSMQLHSGWCELLMAAGIRRTLSGRYHLYHLHDLHGSWTLYPGIQVMASNQHGQQG